MRSSLGTVSMPAAARSHVLSSAPAGESSAAAQDEEDEPKDEGADDDRQNDSCRCPSERDKSTDHDEGDERKNKHGLTWTDVSPVRLIEAIEPRITRFG